MIRRLKLIPSAFCLGFAISGIKGDFKNASMTKLKAIPTGGGWLKVTAVNRRPHQRYPRRIYNGCYRRDSPAAPPHSRPYRQPRTYYANQGERRSRPNSYQNRRMESNRRRRSNLRPNSLLLNLFPTPIPSLATKLSPSLTYNPSFQNLQSHPPKFPLPNQSFNKYTTMAKNRQLNLLHRNQPHPTRNTPNPGRSYAQVTTPPPNLPVVAPYHQSTWRFFMDHNPWTTQAAASNSNLHHQTADDQPTLRLPPNPNHQEWKNRCYNCLAVGHDQNDCLSEDRVCARCWKSGHTARDYAHPMIAKRQRFDPLQPQGNLGESGLPTNRPQTAIVFIPQTPHIQRTNSELSNAIVIDTKLRPYHNHNTLQSLLMSTCNSTLPYPLTHMADTRYILVLPMGEDRGVFLAEHTASLHDLGLVAYPWSSGIDAASLSLKYKVWIQLNRLSPH